MPNNKSKEHDWGWIPLAAFLAIAGFFFLSWMFVDTTGSESPLAWSSRAVPVMILEGKSSIQSDCFGQNPHFAVADRLVYKMGVNSLWDTNDEMLEPVNIARGKQVAIYEKKFWWMKRYFIVCEEQ